MQMEQCRPKKGTLILEIQWFFHLSVCFHILPHRERWTSSTCIASTRCCHGDTFRSAPNLLRCQSFKKPTLVLMTNSIKRNTEFLKDCRMKRVYSWLFCYRTGLWILLSGWNGALWLPSENILVLNTIPHFLPVLALLACRPLFCYGSRGWGRSIGSQWKWGWLGSTGKCDDAAGSPYQMEGRKSPFCPV